MELFNWFYYLFIILFTDFTIINWFYTFFLLLFQGKGNQGIWFVSNSKVLVWENF